MTECKQAIFLDLQKHTNEDGLPIMDRQTFEMVTNSIGKEKFREQLSEYIAQHRPKFPLKNISYDVCVRHLKVYKNKMYGNM